MDEAPRIEIEPGKGGRLVYDKDRKAIVAQGRDGENDASWNAAIDACRKAVAKFKEYPTDCECLGMVDPETGAAECSLESRGADCLCVASMAMAEKIDAALGALSRRK